jgi:hypothetical protein
MARAVPRMNQSTPPASALRLLEKETLSGDELPVLNDSPSKKVD